MLNAKLTQAVEDFTNLLLPVSEKDLERDWVWKDHDEEGIRFAFFVTLQELRQLAIKLAALRPSPTSAQRILGQYHIQYMDLQAAILGLSSEDAERAPADGEWPIRKVYAHILGTDIGFTATVRYALEKHRAGSWNPERMTDEDETRLSGMTEEGYNKFMQEPFENLLAYHRGLHPEIIRGFANISEKELDLPCSFWEETRFPIRHRLHRYEAHFVQHTVQIDKTLVAIRRAPNESKRILRYIYAALAEAESALIGAETVGGSICEEAAKVIEARTQEIAAVLKN